MKREDLTNMYITEVYQDFECDTFFAEKKEFKKYLTKYNLVSCSKFEEENNIHFRYFKYQKKDFDLESQNIYQNEYLKDKGPWIYAFTTTFIIFILITFLNYLKDKF